MRVVTVVALFLALLATPGVADRADVLVTVGDVTSTTAVLWLRAAPRAGVTVELRTGGVPGTARIHVPLHRDADYTAKTVLTALRPGTRYSYRVLPARVSGEFVTAPAQDSRGRISFLWSGDLGGGNFCRRLDGGYPIFRTMAQRRPDFFVFVGDTIYADRRCSGPDLVPSNFLATTLQGYRDKHRYNREDDAVQTFFRGTSVYAIWDDHDVRNDMAGPTEPLMPIGRQAFLEYWPIVPPADDATRLYRKFRWGTLLEIFVLDTRQYRSRNEEPDGPGKTMLGEAQRRWLIEEVSASAAVWKVVVSSVSLSIPTGRPERRDSWSNANVLGFPQENGTGFAVERDAILRMLADRQVKNLVVLTADVHHAELIRHHPAPGFSLHEFIAGPLSATLGAPRPLDMALNPHSIFAVGGVNTFGEIVIARGQLTVSVFDEAGALLVKRAIRPA